MKNPLKALIALVLFAVSAAVSSLNGQTTVQFTSLTTPTIEVFQKSKSGNPGEDLYVVTFNVGVLPSGGDAVMFLGEASIFDGVSASLYNSDAARVVETFNGASFNSITGATIGNGGLDFVVHAGQQASFTVQFFFYKNPILLDDYRLTFNNLSFQWGNVSAFTAMDHNMIDWGNTGLTTSSVNLTGPGWIAGSAIPEPSTYAAIFGAAGLVIAFMKRRKSLQPGNVTCSA